MTRKHLRILFAGFKYTYSAPPFFQKAYLFLRDDGTHPLTVVTGFMALFSTKNCGLFESRLTVCFMIPLSKLALTKHLAN